MAKRHINDSTLAVPVQKCRLRPVPGKRIAALSCEPAAGVVRRQDIAFDHAAVVEQAVEATRTEVAAMQFPQGWVAEPFTLGELQALSEAVLGVPLDKVTFRRRIESLSPVEALQGQLRSGGAHRPAQLYRLRAST